MDSLAPPSGRFGATLIRYVARELLFPVFFAFLGLTLLILTKDLLSFSDLVINRGFGIGAVSLIALYEIIPLAAHTLPFAVLVGSLIGLGRLKADNEIIAIEAAGVSGRKLIIPVLCLAALTTMTGLVLNLFAAPWASRSLPELRHRSGNRARQNHTEIWKEHRTIGVEIVDRIHGKFEVFNGGSHHVTVY